MNESKSKDFNEILLIVDDESDIVEILLECAAKASVRAIGTTSVREAEEILKTERAFLLFTDFRMPEEDGLSFFGRMRDLYPLLPGILVTANADKDAAFRAVRVGILDIIEKPFKLTEIVNAIVFQKEKRLAEIAADAEEMKLIADMFVRESREILQDIDSIIMDLESDVGNERHVIDNLYRRVHTIKGTARSVPGTEFIFEIAHAWESLLSTYREGRAVPTADSTDAMLNAADTLRKCVDSVFSENPFVPDVPAIRSELSSAIKSSIPQGAKAVVAPVSADSDDGIIWVTPPPGSESSTLHGGASSKQAAKGATPARENIAGAAAQAQGADASHISVNTKKIDSFMEVTGELVVLRNSLQSVLETLIREGSVGARAVKPFAKELSEITSRLQRDVLEIRRVRFDSIVKNLQRTVREIARALKKEISFEIIGNDVEIDRDIAKRISPALVHLVRNSCDHGLELPAERLAAGKASLGKITVSAQAKRGFVEVIVQDDGRGLSREKILAKAIERKLVDAERASKLSDSEIFDFIFRAGFSTATVVSDVSGRGVGMDVVRNEIAAASGTVKIHSVEGNGASFVMSIPEVRSVMVEKLAVFSLAHFKIALPLGAVATIFRFNQKSVVEHPLRTEIEFQNQLQPLLRASDVFHSLAGSLLELGPNDMRMGILLKHNDRRVVVEVSDIDSQLDAVIRPLDATTKDVPACKGIALLSDDQLAYALVPERLVERAYALRAA